MIKQAIHSKFDYNEFTMNFLFDITKVDC